MRVAFVDQSGALGGGEFSLFDIVTHLPGPSRVILFSDGPFRELLATADIHVDILDAGKLSAVRLAGTYSSVISSLPALYRLKKELQAITSHDQLIYANSQKAFIVAALAVRTTGRPLVWHLRDILTAKHFNSLLARTAVFLANKYASQVIANSNATRQSFIDLGGDPNRVSVIYNGINAEPFGSVDDEQVGALRARIAPGTSFLVGVFGRLCDWKGQHILVRALEFLPDVHAVIVGDALFGETDYAEQLAKMSHNPLVRDRIHLLGFRRDIPELMKAVDVVVHTSIAPEPFGRVLVEGMLAGRPVIATHAGGAVEIVQHQVTGLLVPPSDAKALADAIATLQHDRELAKRLALAGQQSAKANFSLASMVKGVENVIDSVVKKKMTSS